MSEKKLWLIQACILAITLCMLLCAIVCTFMGWWNKAAVFYLLHIIINKFGEGLK
jgi:hypothetical protein